MKESSNLKKTLAICLLLLLSLSLFSCSLYDEQLGSDISMFVDPANNLAGNAVPDSNADAVVVPPQEPEEEPLPAGYTRIDNPEIRDEYYYGPGFRLYVPFTWRTRMAIEILAEEENGMTVTTYDFYYVQEDGVEATMFRLFVCPPTYTSSAKLSGTEVLGTSSDGATKYYMYRLTEALPEGFTEVDQYIEIYQKIGEAENSGFEITN